MNRQIAFPYRLAPSGQTETSDLDDYIRDLLAQIVFTDPGERVNRPDFGCSLRRLVFTDGRSETTAAVEALIHSALRQWVGEVVQIQQVDVTTADSLVAVTIGYLDVHSQTLRRVTLTT
ncbi:MAG: hypothetical protein E7773_07945 [Sphingomonas sp.]|uniref:GPW/gp25 family protein n=1 Tax=Sphingomonas sp. TaxID=28214 RepID=UPI0011FEF4D6|nr:GPW/gp25 family protein [Sphingomonas sp.]THD35872.1 MAG: hypothetical protein E7773_07945 [Sphingomonas sp.]